MLTYMLGNKIDGTVQMVLQTVFSTWIYIWKQVSIVSFKAINFNAF